MAEGLILVVSRLFSSLFHNYFVVYYKWYLFWNYTLYSIESLLYMHDIYMRTRMYNVYDSKCGCLVCSHIGDDVLVLRDIWRTHIIRRKWSVWVDNSIVNTMAIKHRINKLSLSRLTVDQLLQLIFLVILV